MDFQNKWEVIELLNGERYAYRGGLDEDAAIEDIVQIDSETEALSQFTVNHKGATGRARLNRALIIFAWIIDPDCELYKKLESFRGSK
jgi:hypothetical protein